MSNSSRLAFADAEKHHKKLSDPMTWPLWPVLPLKRFRNGTLETAWVTADYPNIVMDERPVNPGGIILQLRWELSTEALDELGFFDPRRLYGPDTEAHYRDHIFKTYQDVWAVVDDGWEVD